MEATARRIKRPKILALSMIIVVGGLFGAMQFRRQHAAEEAPAPSTPAWRADANPAPAGGLRPQAPSPNLSPSAAPALAGRVEPAPGASDGSTAGSSALGGRYADFATAAESFALDSVPSAESPSFPAHLPAEPAAPRRNDLPLANLNEPMAIHEISDGDTLAKLAEKYLGSAARHADLFHYNRDVLKSPDVLPIGAELRIPPPSALLAPAPQPGMAPLAPLNRAIPAAPPPGAASTSKNPAAPRSSNAAPANNSAAPPAAGHRPVAAKRDRPQSYTVQPGDNLVDIARKLYGDGRRYEQLYEANRGQLNSPIDVKPGTVLVVP